MKKKVLFLCIHNSCRSQMAEGILKHFYGDKYEVYSAGIERGSVNPMAIEIMKEIGIDISAQKSKLVSDLGENEFDYVVTTCDEAKQNCPAYFFGKIKIHWNLKDPSEAQGADKAKAFRETRDKLIQLINETFGGTI